MARNVVFGRINRRNPNQDTFGERAFAEDMAALAESHQTTYVERGRSERRWVAADMEITPGGDFATGVLGYSLRRQQVTFDDESFSWMKAPIDDTDTASEQTMAPFAVALGNNLRWVAFAPTPQLGALSFRNGLEHVLNHAVASLGLMPTAWEVDLVTSRNIIGDWLRENPRVFRLRRTIRFTNPGRDLDEDRQQMRRLAANRKTEEYQAAPRKVLNSTSPEFDEMLSGTETGDVDVEMEARSPEGVGSVRFSSKDSFDSEQVEDFGAGLQHGIDVVLAALRTYVQRKGGPPQRLF